MSTDTELATLFETTLRPRIAEMNPLVNKSKRLGEIGKWLILIPWVVFIHFAFYGNYMTVLPRVAVSVVSFAAAIWVTMYGVKHFIRPGNEVDFQARKKIRDGVIAEAYKLIFPGAEHTWMEGIPPEDFAHSGLFRHDSAFSHDRVNGLISKTPFAAVIATVSYQPNQANSDRSEYRQSSFPLHGLFFRFDLPKALRHVTLVQSKKMSSIDAGDRKGLSKTELGNSDFDNAFVTFTSDTNDVHSLLTTPISSAIHALGEHSGKLLYLAFRDNRAYLAMDFGRPLFQPNDSADTMKSDLLLIAALHRLAGIIATGLEQNTSPIWN